MDEAGRLADAEGYFAAIAANVATAAIVACYVPALDTHPPPASAQFERPADYYSTAAHEHVHWTGHRVALARDLSGRFGIGPTAPRSWSPNSVQL